MIKILDDWLPIDYVDGVEKLFFKNHPDTGVSVINWHLNSYTVDSKYDTYEQDMRENPHYIDIHQFTHNFYSSEEERSPHIQKIIKILEESKINWIGIDRIKANYVTNISHFKKDKNVVLPHTDVEKEKYTPNNNFVSMIYYVHNTDGDTLFYEKDRKTIMKKVSPKKGRAVIFYSNQHHSFEPPVKNDKRVVINFVVEIGNA